MRIAILSYHTCPLAILGGKDTGGMNVYVHELTRFLGQIGIHADVFTRSQDEHVPHVLHDLGYGNRVVHIRAGPEIPLPKQELVSYVPDFILGIQEFVLAKNIQYDMINSHYWMSGLAALELKKLWKIPVIHMFHTLGLMKNRVAQYDYEIEGEYRIQGEKQVISEADRIIASTLAELAQLQWLYQADIRKIVVLPPGVDLNRFYPIPVDEAKEYIHIPICGKMLLFVGRIETLKGLEVLLEAIYLIRLQKLIDPSSFCLVIIGGDPDASSETMSNEMLRLYDQIDQWQLHDMIAMLGKRSQDSLPYYYSAAEAVVLPSHYESFGMVALEAMACGTPVVASQVGGLAFLVQDGITGFTVPTEDPAALADRLVTILTDEELRNILAKNALNLAQEYSWDRIVNRLVDVFTDVVNKNNHNEKRGERV